MVSQGHDRSKGTEGPLKRQPRQAAAFSIQKDPGGEPGSFCIEKHPCPQRKGRGQGQGQDRMIGGVREVR